MADAARDVNFEEYDPVSVGKRLQEGRQAMGLTRRDVQEKTGIPENMVYKIETGRAEPSLSRLRKLCRLYDIPSSAIMAEVDGGDDGQASGEAGAEDPVTEARSHLRHAATLLGLKVVDESHGDTEAFGPAVKVDAEDDVSATGVLNRLADFVDGEPHQVDKQKLAARIEAAREELDQEGLEALLDAADERGVRVADDEAARLWSEPGEADSENTAEHLRMLLLVHAVYGVDPRKLSVEALNRLVKELASRRDNRMGMLHQAGKGPVRKYGEANVRRMMAINLLPYLIEAAKAGKAPRLDDRSAYPRATG